MSRGGAALITAILWCGMLSAAEDAAPGQCVIKVGGKAFDAATHAIVIPDDPTKQEEHAAKDLQAHLAHLTGQQMPLLAESKLGDKTPIVVGKCKLIDPLGVKVDFDALGLEGIAIQTQGPALVLAGNRRGVLYAVYTFLEDYCGCRWFTPDCTAIPKTGTFDIGELSVRYVPPLEYRSTDYPNSRDGDWAVRNKMNGTQTRCDEPRGGKIDYSHFVHTFNDLVPPDKYFVEHPEFFSLVNGQRLKHPSQLCLTNPDALEVAKKTVREWIKAAPNATIFSVSQNDWHNYCQCDKCTELANKEESQAGPLIHFVNAIADSIKDDCPDKLIDTLAYQYTRKPPKTVVPRPNVCVRLCSIECCFAHPLDTCPTNASFVADIKGWHEKCNRLYIWDYVIDYSNSVMPFPNLYVLKPNINFFVNNGVKGIYEEANYFSKGGELAELRTYVMAKTLWDPSYDTDKAIDEFLAGYYGAAAKPIREYINLIHRQVREHPDWHVNIWAPPTAPYLTDEVVRQSVALFDQAEQAVAGDATRLHRVQVARLPIHYTRIARAGASYKETPDKLVMSHGAEATALVDGFEKVARAEGLTHIREGGGQIDAWLTSVRATGKELPVVRLKNGKLDLVAVPAIGGRIWKLTTWPGQRDILKRYGTADAEVVEEGGYEEYTQPGYRSPGWNAPYTVAAQDERSLTLVAKLGDLELTRKIELDPDKAIVKIDSTLKNVGKGEVKACLRTHPCYSVSDLQKASAWLLRENGKWEGKVLAPDDPKGSKDEWLRDASIPAGQWMILDETNDAGIVSRFDRTQVSQCLLHRSAADNRVTMELLSPERTLKPGESIQLVHSIEAVENASALVR